jgi:general stress protein YciG
MSDPNYPFPTTKPRVGFAAMDPQRQREIASLGGRAGHKKGTAHEWSSDAARAAAKKAHENRARRQAEQADERAHELGE